MRTIISLALGSMLALPAYSMNRNDKNCKFFDTAIGTRAECIYRGTYPAAIPKSYANLYLTIISPSGGAALGANNQIDDNTRGLGAKIVIQVADGIKEGVFLIRSGKTGLDASKYASGYREHRDAISGANGGICPAFVHSRFAGAGGDASIVTYHTEITKNSPAITIINVAGGGGGGAFHPSSAPSKGGNAGLLDRQRNLVVNEVEGMEVTQEERDGLRWILGGGTDGLPSVISGAGGGAYEDNAAGGKGINGTDGDPGYVYNDGVDRNTVDHDLKFIRKGHGGSGNEGFAYCYAGGGAGGGYFPGGGGGAFGTNDPNIGAAGSGGGGSSEIDDDNKQMYEVVYQDNLYDPDPRVIFTFDIPAAHASKSKPASTKKASTGHGKQQKAKRQVAL